MHAVHQWKSVPKMLLREPVIEFHTFDV